MTGYREALTQAMTDLAADPAVVFLGYGIRTGRAMGTLANVNERQLIEFPVAEGLMVSAAIGLSLAGAKPVVFVERMDFLANAADALLNHIDKLAELSRGEFRPGVIIRCVVGNRTKPLFTGPPHTQNLARGFAAMLSMPVIEMRDAPTVSRTFRHALIDAHYGDSTLTVEFKDLIA